MDGGDTSERAQERISGVTSGCTELGVLKKHSRRHQSEADMQGLPTPGRTPRRKQREGAG